VLLDEVEKAHPDVLELFFQVFDKGRMEDGEGREIDFRNTIILLTSNAATETLMKLTADPETMPDTAGMVKALKPELDKIFKPAFLGRLMIIPYFPVRDEALKQIIRLKLGKIQRRIAESHRICLDYDDLLLNEVAGRCTEVERSKERGQHSFEYDAARSLAPGAVAVGRGQGVQSSGGLGEGWSTHIRLGCCALTQSAKVYCGARTGRRGIEAGSAWGA
jgi:hypothetical protein